MLMCMHTRCMCPAPRRSDVSPEEASLEAEHQVGGANSRRLCYKRVARLAVRVGCSCSMYSTLPHVIALLLPLAAY